MLVWGVVTAIGSFMVAAPIAAWAVNRYVIKPYEQKIITKAMLCGAVIESLDQGHQSLGWKEGYLIRLSNHRMIVCSSEYGAAVAYLKHLDVHR